MDNQNANCALHQCRRVVLSVGQRRSEPYTKGDFWTEKAKQALQLNQNIFENPARFLGSAMVILVLWFASDLLLRWLFSLDRGGGK